MNKKVVKLLALSIMLTMSMYLCGCSKAVDAKSGAQSKTWGLDKFVIVLLPGEDTPTALETRNVFDKELSAVLGIPVEEFHATDYSAAIEALRTGKAQVASLGPFSYVTAVDRSKAECMVVQSVGGTTGYKSYIITKADSSIKTLADLKGKKFALVDPQSTSGNVVPCNEILNFINDPKLTYDDLHANGKFFGSVTFAGTHPNSIQAVIKGDVDAGAVSSSTLANEVVAGHVAMNQIKIIKESPMLPSSPLAIAGSLPKDLKDKVKNFFVNFNDQAFWAGKGQKVGGPKYSYVSVKNDDYAYIRELRDKYNLKD